MNPLRALFLNLSKMPPALMLLIIIGMAVVITMFVTAAESQRQSGYDQTIGVTNRVGAAPVSQDPACNKTAFYSLSYIPAGSVILNKQIESRSIRELELWDDAATASGEIVGRSTKHAIPSNAQIRASDLQ